MKKFRNNLAALERVREMRRREARVALAQRVRQLREHEESVARQTDQLHDAETARQALSGPIEARQLKSWSGWCSRQRGQLARAHSESRDALGRLDTASAEYRAASVESKVLERVRERRYRAWLSEGEREETRFLSESYLQRWNGRNRSGVEES